MNTLRPGIPAAILMAGLCWQGCRETSVVYPVRKEIIETVYASGRIVPGNEYKLSALNKGTIVKKLVKDGDTVSAGQLLYIISNEGAEERFEAASKNYNIASVNLSDRSPVLNDLKLSLHNAEVKLNNDSVTYRRWKNLWEQNIGTKSNLDNAWSSYQLALNQKKMAEYRYHSALNEAKILHGNALSQLTAARKDLNDFYVRSDREGVVYQTFKEAGEAVQPNEVVALLGEHRELVIRLAVDQQDINKIRAGQQVLLQTDIAGHDTYTATITKIFPVMNEADQTFRVDAHFSEMPQQSFIHSSIEANIIVQKKTNALILPRATISGNDSVWVRQKNKQAKVGVRTGISTLDYVEILSGIDEKTAVLLNPKL